MKCENKLFGCSFSYAYKACANKNVTKNESAGKRRSHMIPAYYGAILNAPVGVFFGGPCTSGAAILA